MNRYGHRKIVNLAFECFPPWQENIWKTYKEYVVETCMFPDEYAVPALEGKTGSWRKYFPRDRFTHGFPQHPCSLMTLLEQSFPECLPPIRFYVDRVITHIRQEKMAEAARFAGVFSHYLGDFSQPAHYYELDIPRLLPLPKRMTNCNLHPIIESIPSSIEHISYKAKLLGASEDEFEFYLAARLARLYKKVLAAIIPMVTFIYQRKNHQAQEVFDKLMNDAARIFADFCYTSYAIAQGHFCQGEISHLSKCDLREIEPHSYDVEYNYGHRPLIDVITTDLYNHARPFRLLKREGGKNVTKIVQGICTIPHALPLPGTTPSAKLEYRLPKKTFSQFKATLGLYADVEKQAKCYFEVIADGKSLYKSRMLTPKDTAQSISVDISQCEKLQLLVHTDGSTDKLAYPIWGQPMLRKE